MRTDEVTAEVVAFGDCRQPGDSMLRERLAALQHEIWAHWMGYMFTQGCYCDVELNGKVQRVWIMPEERRVHWERQMSTSYDALSEEERESDRDQADKVLAVLSNGDALT
jgi:hypothetical protein